MSGLRGVEGFEVEIFWLMLPRLSSESVGDTLALRGPLLQHSRKTRALSKKGAETRCQSAKPAVA